MIIYFSGMILSAIIFVCIAYFFDKQMTLKDLATIVFLSLFSWLFLFLMSILWIGESVSKLINNKDFWNKRIF